MKFCNDCQKNKPLSEFYNDKNKKDGRTSLCGECLKARSIKYYYANHEDRKKSHRQWAKNNAELSRLSALATGYVLLFIFIWGFIYEIV